MQGNAAHADMVADHGSYTLMTGPSGNGPDAKPNEVLYVDKHAGRHLVRFAFCKRLDVLDEAVARLRTLA